MDYKRLLEDYINRDYPNSKTVDSFEDNGSVITFWCHPNNDPSYTYEKKVSPFDLLTFIYSKK